MKENDLMNRLFNFAVETIRFMRILDYSVENKVIRYQLVKSSTSSGANYEEAQAGSTKRDFNNKVRISLREMRESNYWFRLIKATNEELANDEMLLKLISESFELKNILGSIVRKTKV